MKRSLGLMIITLGVWLTSGGSALTAPYCDPQQDWGCYERWCAEQGGTVYNNSSGVGCDVGNSTSSSSTSYSPPMGTMDQMMLNTMQGLMNNFMSGVQRGIEINRQKAIQQERESKRRQDALQLQRQEQERLHKEKEKRHRLEFEMAKKRMLGEFRGSQTSSLQYRQLAPLEVDETDGGTFGIRTLKPRNLSQSNQVVSEASSANAWLKKANCSAYLLNESLKNWSDKNFEEAAYLSNEAAALASGEKSSPAVVCPSLPDIPDVKGEQTPESKAKAEKFIKQTMLMSRLFTKAAKQMKNYTAIQNASSQAKKKVDEAKAHKKEAEAKVQAIKREQQQEVETRNQAVESKQQQEDAAKKESVMALALAAVKKANEALALSEKNHADAREKQADMEKSMKDTHDMFQAAQNFPENTDELLDQLSKAPKEEG